MRAQAYIKVETRVAIETQPSRQVEDDFFLRVGLEHAVFDRAEGEAMQGLGGKFCLPAVTILVEIRSKLMASTVLAAC